MGAAVIRHENIPDLVLLLKLRPGDKDGPNGAADDGSYQGIDSLLRIRGRIVAGA